MPVTVAQEYVDAVARLLVNRRGRRQAITIEQIQNAVGLPDRRSCETLMEEHLADFPFPLVAGSGGYYIPASADDVNTYMESLRSREFALYRRRRRVMRKALAHGFQRVGKLFQNPPCAQAELFAAR